MIAATATAEELPLFTTSPGGYRGLDGSGLSKDSRRIHASGGQLVRDPDPTSR